MKELNPNVSIITLTGSGWKTPSKLWGIFTLNEKQKLTICYLQKHILNIKRQTENKRMRKDTP